MISSTKCPVAWALMLYDLDDVGEHVAALAAEMHASGEISEEDFKLQIAHIYAHLNRLWNGRAASAADLERVPWSERSAFPTDISPIG